MLSSTRSIFAILGLAVIATGCSNDGESTSGGGNGSLPISNQPATSSTLPTSTSDSQDTSPTAPAGGPVPQTTVLTSSGRLQITVAGLAMAAESFTLSGKVRGNVLQLSSAIFNGNATIRDGHFEGTVRFALNRPRLDCSGNVKITGNVSSTRLNGRVTGVPDCSVDSAPPITSIIDGRF